MKNKENYFDEIVARTMNEENYTEQVNVYQPYEDLIKNHEKKILNDKKLTKQNSKVNELCGCLGSESTWSRRILKEVHEQWCFYFQHL